MLQTNDVGELFAQLQAAYGHQWAHKGDAIPLWQKALHKFNRGDVLSAVAKCVEVYPDFPPSLGQFVGLVQYNEPMLEGPGGSREDTARLDRIFAYTLPFDKTKNPHGNPHHIRLPNAVAQRRVGEHPNNYEIRIANEVTLALYPRLAAGSY